jgi:two-component system, LytTR family, response regulator
LSRLRVAVVDDEAPARDRLCQLLSDRPDVSIVAVCDGGRSAVAALERGTIDVVFLDVQMPELDGFQVIEAVGPTRLPLVVFVTAFQAYAVHAFAVRALDYLLKPFDAARLEQTLSRARQQLAGTGASAPRRASDSERLMVRDNEVIHLVPTTDIRWIAAAGNYVELHLADRSLLMRATMLQMEDTLPESFVRVHRDTIVHLDFVRELRRYPGGQYGVILRDGTERSVGRRHLVRLGRF